MGTTYSQISRGSSGKEVKTLQELLNSNGNYNLDTDGVFGSKTLAAVQTSTKTENKAPAAPDYSKYSYDASTDTAYQQALAALQQATAAVPTYQASYDDQLQEIYDKIVNRDKFSYDLNSDALYQQYADQYQLMGQQAMMDTMGQAAALTGGYGNSFASTAGNQAYQAYLQQLNQVVPELYGMALDQYNAEGDALLTQYSMLGDMADDEYGKYQDALSQYWQNVSYHKQNADDAYDKGYTDWLNSYQMGVDADNTAYSKQQAEYEKLVSLITSTGYAPTAAELEAAGMSKDQAAAYSDYFNKQNATVTTGGSGKGGGNTVNNGSHTTSEIKEMQDFLGLSGDGKWGPNSQSAAMKKWGTKSADEAWEKYQAEKAGNNGFSGKTYSEAVAYLKSKGVSSASASAVMTENEWKRRKSSYQNYGTGGAEVIYNNSYAEYLQTIVEYKLKELNG